MKKLHYLLPTAVAAIAYYPLQLSLVFLLDHFAGGQILWQAFWFDSRRDVVTRVLADWLAATPISIAVAGFLVLPSIYLAASGHKVGSYLFTITLMIILALVLGLLGASYWQIITVLPSLILLLFIAQLSLHALRPAYA